jgi:choline dehydrogenase-like flavoprotein
LYTKKNGEISKFKNVYIIDSSNFKSIPAGDISLTIMANALRIAVENQND